MKAGRLIVASLLFLVVAIMAAAEDRIEKVAGSKGYRELVYRDEVLAEERSYDALGALLEEKTLGSDSLPVETRSYLREAGRLVRVEAMDLSGIQTGSMSYRYDRNGRLLGVDAEGSLGPGTAGMLEDQGRPQGSWVSGPGAASAAGGSTDARGGSQGAAASAGTATTVLGYDSAGRPAILQTLSDGKLLSTEKRSYREGSLLSSLQTEDKKSGLLILVLYDEAGRVSVRTETPQKGPALKTQYDYDSSGRLVGEVSSGQGRPLSRIYVYGEDGKLSREETRRGGLLLLVLAYIENGREEELYEEGQIFAKATYLGGRKVRDEFYADGAVARTRDY